MLGSVNEYKLPANYHWPTDTADNVDYDTVATRRACARRARPRAPSALGAPSSARARADRVLARRDLARELRLLELGEQPPELRARARSRARAASSSPRTSGAGGPVARASASAGAEQLARELEVRARSPRSALRPRVARRSATDSSVTSTSTGSQAPQVAVDVARGSGALVDEEAEPQVVAGRAPRRARAGARWRAGGARIARDELGARARRGRGSVTRPSGSTPRVCGLAASCSSAPKRSAVAAGELVGERLGEQRARRRARAARRATRSGSRSSATPRSSTASVWP